MACRAIRDSKKPGPKTVKVNSHVRSTPKPLKEKCK